MAQQQKEAAAAMISQEIFDEMVQDNIEEFELTKEDALIETINQLKSMGKDLSSIDVTGGNIRKEILSVVQQLKEENISDEAMIELFHKLNHILLNNNELNEKYQNIFRGNGGLIVLVHYLTMNQNENVLMLVLELLVNLSKNNVQTRDLFEPNGSAKLCSIILFIFSSEIKNFQLLKLCFRCAKVMSKSENNKVALINNNLHQLIITFITQHPFISNNSLINEILKEICHVIKSLCTHDDHRKEMSCAYDNGKKFLTDEVISSLVSYIQNYQNNTDLASCALMALRQLILSEEAVKMVCLHGLMSLPKQILQLDHAPVTLIRALVGLLRNICADDERKNSLVSDGIIPMLIYYMSRDEYQLDAPLMEHILATLAAIALRYPNNSTIIVNSGGIEEIVSVMRRHEKKASLQRQACLTIRNIASRCPELRRRILDCSIEGMLRQAGKLQECIDEAYAALRDLECEVQFVKLSTDGSSFESAYDSFGISKPKFNPVFEETYDIMNRIDQESTAPFAKSKSVFHIDEDGDDEGDDELDEDRVKKTTITTATNTTTPHEHSEHCSH